MTIAALVLAALIVAAVVYYLPRDLRVRAIPDLVVRITLDASRFEATMRELGDEVERMEAVVRPMWTRAFAYAAKIEVEVAATRAVGLALGLSTAQVDEVIAAWSDYHLTRPTVLDWPTVRRAVTTRASGYQWRPV